MPSFKTTGRTHPQAVILIRLMILIGGLAPVGYYACEKVFGNFQVVIPDQVYRSGQPSPHQLQHWIEQYHIKTIVNLRGAQSPYYQQEVDIAQKMGVRIDHLQLSAYQSIASDRLIALIDTLENAPRPILLHCRQGIDRAGATGALAAWFNGQSYLEAKKQAEYLSGPWKYKKGSEHISDLFENYEAWCQKNRLQPDNIPQFKNWARTIYHPGYYFVQIDAPAELTAQPGQPLSFHVKITNKSDVPIPMSNSKLSFELYSKIAINPDTASPEQVLKSYTPLPAQIIQPGTSLTLNHSAVAPALPGSYEIMLDLREIGGTPFVRRGSPVTYIKLVVKSAD